MKKLIVVVILIGLVAGGMLVGARWLRATLTQQLRTGLRSPVTLGTVVWVPPLGVQVRDLAAQSPPGWTQRPWLRLAMADVRIAPWALLWRRTLVVDAALRRPELFIEQLADGRFNLPAVTTSSTGSKPPAVLPRALRVVDGTVTYLDRHTGSQGVEIRVDQIQIHLRQVLPSLALRYQGSGIIRAPEAEAVGEVQLEGETAWDRTTTATATITHRALPLFNPYLRTMIGTDVTAGEGTVRARIQSRGEQVSVPVHVEVHGLAFPPGAMTAIGVPAQQLVQLLQDEQGRLQLDFEVTGRWDQLRVQWDQLIASALQQALRSAMARNVQQVITQGLSTLGQPASEGGEPLSLEDQLRALGKQLEHKFKEQLEDESSSQTPPAE